MATAANDILITRVLRLRRAAATVACIAAYLLFVWAVDLVDLIRLPGALLGVALGVATAGLMLLPWAIAGDFYDGDQARRPRIALPLAVWAHIAIVATALVSETPLRLLLLSMTLMGMTFAALHLGRRQLVWVATSAWATYGLGSVWLGSEGVVVSVEEALFHWLGYSLAVVGGALVAGEVARLREVLRGRTEELEVALAKVRDLAMRDDLTGLYNRRQLLEFLQRQKALADRGTLTFAICYVDLDHFKRVNDRFGHQQGDEVLQAFADVARRVVREEDFVARMGGEEFVLVLINASVTDAVRVADRLRRQTQLMMIHPDSPDFAVTASVGIAAYRNREPIEQLLNRADAAMYAAKSQGRNRVVVAPGIETDGIRGIAAR